MGLVRGFHPSKLQPGELRSCSNEKMLHPIAELWIPTSPYVRPSPRLRTCAARAVCPMSAALSKDMRWRVVKKSYMDEKSVAEIVSDLDVGSAFVKRVLKRFRETGDVATYQGQRLADVPCGR